MPFTPPENQAFRRFVALDVDSVMSALSSLDGGAVDEILTRRSNESGGELGAGIAAGPARAKAAKNKALKVEEELRKVRTEHSAASALIDGLKTRNALGSLDGALDDESFRMLEPGMAVEMRGALSLHPLFQLETLTRNFIAMAPKMGFAKDARDIKENVLPLFGVLTGNNDNKGRILVDLDTGPDQSGRIVVYIDRPMLQVPIEDLEGTFTVVAQVDEVLGEGDEPTMTMRLMRGAPPSNDERTALMEAGTALGPAAKGLGVEFAEADLFIKPPTVVLRPLCIWR